MRCDIGHELQCLYFDAGESIEIIINLFRDGAAFDASGLTAELKLIDYINRDVPVLSVHCTTLNSEGIWSIVSNLKPTDTENLFGKYIYQITLTDVDKCVEILKGNMILYRSYK